MAVYLVDLAGHQRADELVQRPHPGGGALMTTMRNRPMSAARWRSPSRRRWRAAARCRWLRQRLFDGVLNSALTIVSLLVIAALVWPARKVPARRCGLGGIEPRRLPAGNGQARGRRLLAVHRRQVSPVHVRILSVRRAMARQSHLSRSALLLLVPLLVPRIPYKGSNAILFFGVFPVVAFFLLVGGLFGLEHVETRALGRAAGHARHLVHRHHRLAAARHPARARPALRAADRTHAVHRLHRILARRAADHGAVLRDLHAAVVSAAAAGRSTGCCGC